MQTNVPNVFAAGDVVTFPVALLDGDSSSIRHQQVAEAHGEAQPPSSSLRDGNRTEGTAGDTGEQFLRTCKKNVFSVGSSQVTVLL